MKLFRRFLLVLFMLLVIPFSVNAEGDYTALNLEQALNEEGIKPAFKKYEENDDQITIYLFRGKGCGYCRNFLTFLNNIYNDYGQYFKLVSYEVWNNSNNSKLMQEVATYLKEDADGVPFIVIGDDVYAGYISSYDNDIKNSIQELYDTKKEDRYDVFKEIEKNPNGNNNEKKEEKKSEFKLTTESCFLIHCVLLVALFIIFLVYDNYKTAKLIEVIKKGK